MYILCRADRAQQAGRLRSPTVKVWLRVQSLHLHLLLTDLVVLVMFLLTLLTLHQIFNFLQLVVRIRISVVKTRTRCYSEHDIKVVSVRE